MRITGPGASGNTSNIRKTKGTSKGGDFGKLLSSAETDEAAQVSDAASLNALSSLLSLQEVDERTFMDEAKERGTQLLDYLDGIRYGLLSGKVSQEELENITALVSTTRPEVSDPELNAILDEIEVRAAVEVAKWERDN
jgi:hypothetical protein